MLLVERLKIEKWSGSRTLAGMMWPQMVLAGMLWPQMVLAGLQRIMPESHRHAHNTEAPCQSRTEQALGKEAH